MQVVLDNGRQLKQQTGFLKLDLGCGPNKREGFSGVDRLPFDGKVDIITDLRKSWPWPDESVEEAHSSHFLEHLEAMERVHFVNELHRVLVPGGKCQLIVPHWASCRAYGDLTHKWPPVSEFWFYYLSKEWRAANAPHNDFYHCDFEATWGYSVHPQIQLRNQEAQQFAFGFYKEAIQDIICMLTKKSKT
jgi:SAM-dependent methyltransferase